MPADRPSRPLTVRTRGSGQAQEPFSSYRVAGLTLLSDKPIQDLAPLRLEGAGKDAGVTVSTEAFAASERIHQDLGWIANDWRIVTAWWGPTGYRIRVAGVGELAVTSEGESVAVLATTRGCVQRLVEQTLLGPPLILALALRGIWSLHGSAVAKGGSVYAILGESGKGKSTLASFLGAEGTGAWERVGDDILPYALSPEGPMALPHFPQLKLPTEAHYGVHRTAGAPLAGVFLLAPRGAEDRAPIAADPIDGRALTSALVRHTVASRLFTPALLQRHLHACAALARGVKGFRLSYPKRWSALPDLEQRIRALIGER
jgi:hypothetical protein